MARTFAPRGAWAGCFRSWVCSSGAIHDYIGTAHEIFSLLVTEKLTFEKAEPFRRSTRPAPAWLSGYGVFDIRQSLAQAARGFSVNLANAGFGHAEDLANFFEVHVLAVVE